MPAGIDTFLIIRVHMILPKLSLKIALISNLFLPFQELGTFYFDKASVSMRLKPQPVIRFSFLFRGRTSSGDRQMYNAVMMPVEKSETSGQQKSPRGIVISATSDAGDDDREVSEALTKFFSNLMIDLQVR